MHTDWLKFAQTQAKSQCMSSESINPTGSSSEDSLNERNRQLELQIQRLLNLLKDKDTEIERLRLKIEQLEQTERSKQELGQNNYGLNDEQLILVSNSLAKLNNRIESQQQSLNMNMQSLTRIEQTIRQGMLENQSLSQENRHLHLENQQKIQENNELFERLCNCLNTINQQNSKIRQLESTIQKLQHEYTISKIQNDHHIEQMPISMHFEPIRYNEGEKNMSASFSESEFKKGRIPTGYQESSNKTYSHRMNAIELESTNNNEEISKLQKQIEYLTQLVTSLIKQRELNTEQVSAYTTPQQALDGLKEFLARS